MPSDASVSRLDAARARLDRARIEVKQGELPRLVREAETVLMAQNAGIYQRGGQLVRIVCLENDSTQQGVKRPAGSEIIVPVTKEYLRLALARVADWEHYDRRAQAKCPIDPPVRLASALLSAVGEWQLPVLTGLTAAPTLRADGSLLCTPGYDPASGLFGAFEAEDFPAINPRPLREDALQALAELNDLFSECVFSGGPQSAHASVAVAATITAAVRHALSTAPATGIGAHKQGSGKTTVAKAIARVCTGHDPPVLALSDDEAELRKCLLGILIAGDACVLIDNVAHPVDSPALCAVLTSATYSDRVLGVNQRVVVPTASTWLITGNHLEFIGDLTTRVLLSVLDPEVEHPEARAFKRDLAAYVAEHRGRFVAAALTIPLAYLAAGEPVLDAPRSRYLEWDRLVRRPLLWLGAADPLETQAELHDADPAREALLELLQAWHFAFGETPTTVAKVVQAATEQNQAARPHLLEALQGVAGGEHSVNTRRLGRYLLRIARRIEDGLRFENCGEDPATHRRMFRVHGVTVVSGVSANPKGNDAAKEKGRNRTDAENASNAASVCRACDGEGCKWCR